MAVDVARFFDEQAGSYARRLVGMEPFHRLTAARMEARLTGRVASIGGVWAGASMESCRALDLIIVDISSSMLASWTAEGFETIVGDARATPFEDASMDHVVLPLVLHHITEGGFRRARRALRTVIAEARRILRPGGRVWISDFSVCSLVYAAEAVASPITKRVLGLAGIPLVVMHPVWVYRRVLDRAGFTDVDEYRPRPATVPRFVRPVIGLDWLVVPHPLYPITPVLVSGRAR